MNKINIKTQKIELEQLESMKCPLCGGILTSQGYKEAIEELRNRTEDMYKTGLEEQKLEYEIRINQLNESQQRQLRELKKFYSDQNEILKEQINRANQDQLNQLKRNYEDSINNYKQQLAISKEEGEKYFKEQIQKQYDELNKAKELQNRMKEIGIEEGKKSMQVDIQDLRNELLQKNIQLQRLNVDLEKLKNETHRTQSELKGEAGEVTLYSRLESAFKDDTFERQKRGFATGDIIQRIKTSTGILETPIIFDNKESQGITKNDIEKAKSYKMTHKTNYVMIVSKNLPKAICGEEVIGEKEGILLVHPTVVIELTRQIRKFIMDLTKERISNRDRHKKEVRKFEFITSQEVARRLNSLYDAYTKMKDLQVKEERDHQTLWKNKNMLIEYIKEFYVEINGGIDSIVQASL